MAEFRTSRVHYANGASKIIGYLYSDFELAWELEQQLNSPLRPPRIGSQMFLLSYPATTMIHGAGAPPCLGPQGQAWNWVQLVEVGLGNRMGWWFGNCYDLQELVRWREGANLVPRTYQLRNTGLVS